MKKNQFIIFMIAIAGLITSCSDDYLTIYPSNNIVAGAPATQDVIEKNVTSAYQLLLFDDFAYTTSDAQFAPINMFFDICSDDIFKGGGDAADQGWMLGVSEFRSTPTLTLTGIYNIYYIGLKRCNGALEAIDHAVDVRPEILAKLRAEMLTLRAYYVHWLWKIYGNIPYYDKAWTEEPFLAKQYTFEELYPLIVADLDAAIAESEFPMSDNTGRASKAMAMMTKARTVMYFNDQSKYPEVLNDMKTILNDGAFSLITTARQPNYMGYMDISNSTPVPSTDNPFEWVFLRDGEFCSESIFEVNRIPEGKSAATNIWGGYGTYIPRFIGPRDATGMEPFTSGWGFFTVNPVTFDAIFNESGDYRRDASVMRSPSTGPYQNPAGMYLKKYGARQGYNIGVSEPRDMNYEINQRIFRVAETYLNAAELEVAAGGGTGAAQQYLDAIRDRAFGDTDHRIPATLNNIKLERHREFFGEGQRFWDLVRWGSDENGRSISEVLTVNDPSIPLQRVWDDSKKFLPFAQAEIDRTKGTEFELKQNPGY